MISTRVGYAGGTTSDPTYLMIGDHTETLQVYYDPTVISYGELLDVFWDSHDPTDRYLSRQYRSAIFYHDEEQRRQALETMGEEAENRGGEIMTGIELFSRFYPAEDYHQKYRLQQMYALMEEYRNIYPDFNDFVNSTAVARVNGYLGGNGTLEQLEEEIELLGLSPEGRSDLLRLFNDD